MNARCAVLALCSLLATPAWAREPARGPEEGGLAPEEAGLAPEEAGLAPEEGGLAPAEGGLYEMSVGVLAHDVNSLWSGSREESGLDLNAELVLRRPSFLFLSGVVRPHLGLSLNTRGDTSKLYAGLKWLYRTDSGWFFKLGLGGAVHDGERETRRAGKKELGSRLLFHIPMELGHALGRRHQISVYFDHVSNASLADANEGLDTMGVRYGYLF